MPNLSKTLGMSGRLYLSTIEHAQSFTGKKSGKLTIPLLLLLAISFFGLPAQADYGGGSGTAEDPYLIYDANQMNTIGTNPGDLDKHFKLMADIDLSGFTGTAFNIIGSYGNPFTGVFDGSDHTISNFSYTSVGTSYIALFAYVSGENADIKNLGLIDPNVDSGRRDYAGSLVSQLSGATITNCYVQGGSVSGAMNIGGLVGNNNGTITNSYSMSSVSGDNNVGGLVGSNGGTISNCYATSSTSGGNAVGGLVGSNGGTITNCYSTASVSGASYLGGLLGYNRQGETANSFWDIETSGQSTSAGGTPKTTAEMKTASTFITWACNYFWTIDEGQDYPRLDWQNATGEPIAALLWDSGSGTQADPYLIYTAEQLNTIGLLPCEWGKHFKLMADIDLSIYTGTAFNIIGTDATPFTGTFDGNGHTISNFSYTSTQGDNIGLFGCIDGPDTEIKDLGLITPDVDGGAGDCLGSLVGYVKGGTITACYAEDGSVSGNYGGDLDYTYHPISPNLRNISWTGTRVELRYYEMSYAIHLPFNFNFNFYDRRVSELFISPTGFITFLSGSDSGWGQQRPLPDPYTPNGLIAGFWSYLYPDAGGTIRYQTLGPVGSRQFVIGFYGVPYCCEPGYYPVTFEIILHEGTNNIELQYASALSPGYYTSVGIENFDGTDGLQVAYGYDISFNNEAFLITAFSGSKNVGALVGQNEGTIFNSYSTSDVSGVDGYGIGGLVGGNFRLISDCYSTGSVWGNYHVGGLVGYNEGGEVTGSFWDIQTSGQYSSAGGTGKTTAEMHNTNTYMDAGWNFVGKPDGPSDIWAEPPSGPQPPPTGPGGYPILWWQLSPLPELPTFSGGTGTADDPYLISTAAELNSLSYNPRLMQAHFKLIDDIDLTGVDFYIIGSRDYPYSGVFDGNDHTISNFTYTSTGTSHIALFGYVRGVIKDLGLLDSDVDAPAAEYVASLVGQLNSGTITNCYATGSVEAGNGVGGLVGYNYRGTITNSYATTSVWGNYSGGLVGWNYGTVTDCYTTGSISGRYSGGLVGWNYGIVTNCYTTGSVSWSYSGGLVGWNVGTVTDCYSTGSVSGSRSGGVVGYNEYGTVTNCYATGSISGNYSGGLVGYNYYGTVTNCHAEGDVSGYYAGGLVGRNYGTITNCYSEGDVSGYYYIGGLVGRNYDGTISNCYATGSASGNQYVGGLVGYNGYNDKGTIINCYSEGDVSGDYNVGGLVGYNESFASIFLDHTLSPISNNLRNIRLTGTAVTLGYYEMSSAIPLPFNFNFYDTEFSELFISPSGFITFLSGQSSGWGQQQPLPDPYTPNGLIAGFWTYLYPDAGGTIRYQTLGEEGSRQFVIGFYQVPHCCEPGYYPVTFEIILHEGTNNIELQYGWAPSAGYYISVGIENLDGTDGLQVAYGYDVSFSHEGFLITPEGPPVEIIGGISRCYSTGSVSGTTNVGGLLGDNVGSKVYFTFWDTETSGQTDSDGGTGKTTDEMQTAGTFTDARWDFNTPVWTIDEGVDYPHLWWEQIPVLHAEPELTLWTSNTITWDPLPGASEYYAECATDANFTSILYNSGWITETSYQFTGLQLGKHYWYSVKARNSAGVESYWSNVESSLQITLADAVDMMLDPKSLKNRNMKNALLNKINALQKMIADGLYAEALDKLRNDILQKTDGCAKIGQPDRNDWIKTCEAQSRIYPLIIEAIENVSGLVEQSPNWLRTSTRSSGDTRRVTLPSKR